jgi:hypothetical protein
MSTGFFLGFFSSSESSESLSESSESLSESSELSDFSFFVYFTFFYFDLSSSSFLFAGSFGEASSLLTIGYTAVKSIL